MGDIKSQALKTFKYFVESTSAGQTLSEADKKEIKDKGLNKLLKECCDDVVAKVAEAQVFPKYCDKKTKKLNIETFYGPFLDEVAAVSIQNKKKMTKRPELNAPDVQELAEQLRQKIAAKHDITTKVQGVDATTARLTDTSKYTGSHKERFDESGQGKGIAGREDAANTSGYVQGYKNESTYEKK